MNWLRALLVPDPDGELADLRDQVVKLTLKARQWELHYRVAKDERDRAIAWCKNLAAINKKQAHELAELRRFLTALTPAQMPEVKR